MCFSYGAQQEHKESPTPTRTHDDRDQPQPAAKTHSRADSQQHRRRHETYNNSNPKSAPCLGGWTKSGLSGAGRMRRQGRAWQKLLHRRRRGKMGLLQGLEALLEHREMGLAWRELDAGHSRLELISQWQQEVEPDSLTGQRWQQQQRGQRCHC